MTKMAGQFPLIADMTIASKKCLPERERRQA